MNPIDPTLRRALPTDVPSITETFISARSQAMPFLPVLHTREQIASWIEKSVLRERDVWVADFGGKCVGFVVLAPEELDHLYVHPDHQGRGLGKALLELAKNRFTKLQLFVFQKNAGARRFYEREGFKLVSLGDGSANEEREPDALYEWRKRQTPVS